MAGRPLPTQPSGCKNLIVVLILSVLAAPIAYTFNSLTLKLFKAGMSSVALLVCVALLITVMLVLICFTRDVKNKLFYGFGLFTFTSVIDLLLGLELDGYISGFMTVYVENAEPYLNCPYGAYISYIDGFMFYVLHATMAYKASQGLSFRTVALFWAAAILDSMFILLIGFFVSGVRWCTLLNLPYFILPLFVGAKCLMETRPTLSIKPRGLPMKFVDLALAAALVCCAVFLFIRGEASLGSHQPFPAWFRERVEPGLMEREPVPYLLLQALIGLFYFMPSALMLAAGLVWPGRSYMHDLSIIFAGAMAQAQIAHMGTILHWKTPEQFRGYSPEGATMFWFTNLLLLIVPQIVALRVCWTSAVVPEEKKKKH